MGRPSKSTEEFRREAVELFRASERLRCRVADDLGVSDGTLAAWVREFDARGAPGALNRRLGEIVDTIASTEHTLRALATPV